MNAPVQRRDNRFRNTAFVIGQTRGNFDAAYAEGVMGVYGLSTIDRNVKSTHQPADFVDFVRCSYLGLDNHPDIVAGAMLAIEEYQSLHWSCARTRLNFGILQTLEHELSLLFKARVIAYSSVMVANLGALPLIASGHLTGKTKPIVAFDRYCHASLAFHKPVVADETQVVTIPHNDMDALEDLCRQGKPVAYVTDGVYSMGGSSPISDLCSLQERYELFLYIDDAHGISIFGKNGEGFARSQLPEKLGEATIIAASLGKGFGASGGILMLGTKEQEDLFRRYSLPYAFSAAPNIAAVGAALASARLHASSELTMRQNALADRIALFDEHVPTSQRGEPIPIRFVSIGDERKAIALCRWIYEQGFFTSATFFPTVARGAAGIRVCLTSSHSLESIDRLGHLLNAARCSSLSEQDQLASTGAE